MVRSLFTRDLHAFAHHPRSRSDMPITIMLATGTPEESNIRNRLLRMLWTYDLRKWQFTDRVRIDRMRCPTAIRLNDQSTAV